MIKVIIADDHVIFRQGLLKLLQSATDIAVIGEAGEGHESLGLIKKEIPDVAVLDISMPGLNGIEIVQEIEILGLATNVIFLTMHNDPLTAKKAMQTNALGYVLKDDAFEDLLYAIRAVAFGRTFISPSISQKILKSGKPKETENRILTEREQEVLRLIALGLTNKKIAEKLFISVKTVDTHRTRILQKLGAHTAADLVRYAIKIGLIEIQ